MNTPIETKMLFAWLIILFITGLIIWFVVDDHRNNKGRMNRFIAVLIGCSVLATGFYWAVSTILETL